MKKNKLYEYNIALSNDDDLEYTVLPAFRKLVKRLRRDTQINSFEHTEIIDGDAYSKSRMKSKFIAIIKTIKVTPYIKELDNVGLNFKVHVSFDEADICTQYFNKMSTQKLYGMQFIILQNTKGDLIELSQTEVTNSVFNSILPNIKRDKECEITEGLTEPVNCISYSHLDSFLEKLNKISKEYKYRFLTCKEAIFFSTCGNKQKYCWGNQDNFDKYEFLRLGKYDLSLHKVAKKEVNGLRLFDFCGNAVEYCTDKRGWYKTFGSNTKHLEPTIYKNSYSDISSIRLVREKK